MKYIFSVVFLLLLSSILRAEEISVAPKPVPAPTSALLVMDVEHNESLSSKSSRAELKESVGRIKQNKDYTAHIIFYEKRARSNEASRMANQIKNYLVKNEGINSDRIEIIYGGINNIQKIKIYLMPRSMPAENSSGQTSDSNELLNYITRRKTLSSG